MNNRLEALRGLAQTANIEIVTAELPCGMHAAYVRAGAAPVIALSSALGQREENRQLALALGHHYTGGGNHALLPPARQADERRRACLWAYQTLLPIEALARAFLDFDENLPALANALCLPADFIEQAIAHYAATLGPTLRLPGLTIHFFPAFRVLALP